MKFLRLTVLGLVSVVTIFAQATGQIHGLVKDASGSAVPGAEIKATQAETGLSRAVTSGGNGEFVLTSLPVGTYQVEIAREGFTKFVQPGVLLEVNGDPAIDASLKVGSVNEQVIVEANSAEVETRSSGVGEVVQTRQIVDLPLNGRNVTDLITLSGAAVSLGNVRAAFFSNLPMIAIAGQTEFGADYSLDGANHGDYLTGTSMPVAFPDAVQEFKVETSGQTAQRGAAASVSMVTRSGTNEYHGNLFEFIRNDGFGSAREYFSKTTSSLKRNQFGGTAGGPIMKNKLFFFGGFQGTILRQNANNLTTTVPTAQMLAGDWSTFASAQCNNGVAKTLKAPFVNSQISPSLYSAPALFIVNKFLPTLGTTPDACGNIIYGTPLPENDKQFVGKFDYQINEKQSVFFRFLDTTVYIPNALSVTPNLLNLAAQGADQFAQSYALGHTFLVSPAMVQSFRMAYHRTATNVVRNKSFDYCQAGVQEWCGGQPSELGQTTITGGFPVGSGTLGETTWFMGSFGFNDDLNMVKGAHQLTVGAGLVTGKAVSINHFASGSQFTFNGSITGLGMADFLLGVPSTFFQGLPNSANTAQDLVNIYFTDSWKVTPRLTFNFGVRWEPFLPQTITNGQISNFDMGRFLSGTKSTVFTNAPYGFYFPGDPGFPGKSGTYNQWMHFDPRGGLAWDPRGDGKTSIRAAYSFGYSYVAGSARQDQAGSNPWGGRSTYTNIASFTNPYGNVPGGNPLPFAVDKDVKFTNAGQFITTPYDLETPNTYSWNISAQHEIHNWLFSATYLGSRVMHLALNVPINYAVIVPGPSVASGCAATATNCNATANVQARRVLSLLNPSQGQFIGNMDKWDASGTQRYNASLLSVQRKFSRGVSINANWTWSHCIGMFQGFQSKPDQTVTAPGNAQFDRGNCDSDRRHIVNLTAVAQTPNFNNSLLRMTASGWQIAGIYAFRSGTPIAIQDGTDRELTGLNHQRPNLIDPANVYTGNSGPSSQYLNPLAFAPQPLGTIGNLGWNSIVGPAYWDIDLAVSRQFQIRERQKIELRADAFNITNSFVANLTPTAMPTSTAIPVFANVASNQFGKILTAYPTRKIQFALKYIF